MAPLKTLGILKIKGAVMNLFYEILKISGIIYIFLYIIRVLMSIIIGNISEIASGSHSRKNTSIHEFSKKNKYPINGISVIIPCHNEEKIVKKCIVSVYRNKIDKANIEVIAVNDGSTDGTSQVLKSLKKYYNDLIIVEQENSGKGSALNNGIFNYSTKDLIMVLDADSTLDSNSLQSNVDYFSQNSSVIACASCIFIDKYRKIIEILQYFDYMIGSQFKLSEKAFNNIFIIGGVASVFRTKELKEVGGYDKGTKAEDLDLSMKLINYFGNKDYHLSTNFNSISYTPPAHNIRDLIVQRYRWKYGLFQTLLKYKHMFFSRNIKKYSISLTWWKLPVLLFADEVFVIISPFIFIPYYLNSITTNNLSLSFVVSSIFITLLIIISPIISAKHITFFQKIFCFLLSPFVTIFMYIMVLVDFLTVILCLFKTNEIINKKNKKSTWDHIER